MSMQKYLWNVMNMNGYVVLLPNVQNMEELKGVMAEPNPYAESSTQKFPLGTRLVQGEREWVYCKNGASALSTLGTPIQNAKPAHAEQDDDIVVGAAAAIGATTVELTSTANLDTDPNDDADDFAEGYFIVNDAPGQGQMYKIKTNEAFSGTDDSTFTLYDALTVALTTSSQVGLIRNPFYKVIATESVVSGMFVGVNLIAVTAAYYFWAQTKGPAPAVAQAAIAKGTPVVVGVTAAKFDPMPASYSTLVLQVGHALTPGVADTEQFMVYLK